MSSGSASSHVFGNTVYSASVVVAVFMLGLGAGSYLAGVWSDRRYAANPDSPLRAYGYFEIAIAAMGLAIALILPHLDRVSVLVSSYAQDANGWYVITPASHAARAGIAVALLLPISLLMGGTLTLLIRHLVRRDVEAQGRRIALLYAVNTAGAAVGCFLTDFTLVPAWGLRNTQFMAVALNIVAGVGAILLVRLSVSASGQSREASARPRQSARSAREGGRRTLPARSRRGPYQVRGRWRGRRSQGPIPNSQLPLPKRLSLQRRARVVRVRGTRHGNPLVPPFLHHARRLRAVFSLLLHGDSRRQSALGLSSLALCSAAHRGPSCG